MRYLEWNSVKVLTLLWTLCASLANGQGSSSSQTTTATTATTTTTSTPPSTTILNITTIATTIESTTTPVVSTSSVEETSVSTLVDTNVTSVFLGTESSLQRSSLVDTSSSGILTPRTSTASTTIASSSTNRVPSATATPNRSPGGGSPPGTIVLFGLTVTFQDLFIGGAGSFGGLIVLILLGLFCSTQRKIWLRKRREEDRIAREKFDGKEGNLGTFTIDDQVYTTNDLIAYQKGESGRLGGKPNMRLRPSGQPPSQSPSPGGNQLGKAQQKPPHQQGNPSAAQQHQPGQMARQTTSRDPANYNQGGWPGAPDPMSMNAEQQQQYLQQQMMQRHMMQQSLEQQALEQQFYLQQQQYQLEQYQLQQQQIYQMQQFQQHQQQLQHDESGGEIARRPTQAQFFGTIPRPDVQNPTGVGYSPNAANSLARPSAQAPELMPEVTPQNPPPSLNKASGMFPNRARGYRMDPRLQQLMPSGGNVPPMDPTLPMTNSVSIQPRSATLNSHGLSYAMTGGVPSGTIPLRNAGLLPVMNQPGDPEYPSGQVDVDGIPYSQRGHGYYDGSDERPVLHGMPLPQGYSDGRPVLDGMTPPQKYSDGRPVLDGVPTSQEHLDGRPILDGMSGSRPRDYPNGQGGMFQRPNAMNASRLSEVQKPIQENWEVDLGFSSGQVPFSLESQQPYPTPGNIHEKNQSPRPPGMHSSASRTMNPGMMMTAPTTGFPPGMLSPSNESPRNRASLQQLPTGNSPLGGTMVSEAYDRHPASLNDNTLDQRWDSIDRHVNGITFGDSRADPAKNNPVGGTMISEIDVSNQPTLRRSSPLASRPVSTVESQQQQHGIMVHEIPRQRQQQYGTTVDEIPHQHQQQYGTTVDEIPQLQHQHQQYGTMVDEIPHQHQQQYGTTVDEIPQHQQQHYGTMVDEVPQQLPQMRSGFEPLQQVNMIQQQRSGFAPLQQNNMAPQQRSGFEPLQQIATAQKLKSGFEPLQQGNLTQQQRSGFEPLQQMNMAQQPRSGFEPSQQGNITRQQSSGFEPLQQDKMAQQQRPEFEQLQKDNKPQQEKPEIEQLQQLVPPSLTGEAPEKMFDGEAYSRSQLIVSDGDFEKSARNSVGSKFLNSKESQSAITVASYTTAPTSASPTREFGDGDHYHKSSLPPVKEGAMIAEAYHTTERLVPREHTIGTTSDVIPEEDGGSLWAQPGQTPVVQGVGYQEASVEQPEIDNFGGQSPGYDKLKQQPHDSVGYRLQIQEQQIAAEDAMAVPMSTESVESILQHDEVLSAPPVQLHTGAVPYHSNAEHEGSRDCEMPIGHSIPQMPFVALEPHKDVAQEVFQSREGLPEKAHYSGVNQEGIAVLEIPCSSQIRSSEESAGSTVQSDATSVEETRPE